MVSKFMKFVRVYWDDDLKSMMHVTKGTAWAAMRAVGQGNVTMEGIS